MKSKKGMHVKAFGGSSVFFAFVKHWCAKGGAAAACFSKLGGSGAQDAGEGKASIPGAAWREGEGELQQKQLLLLQKLLLNDNADDIDGACASLDCLDWVRQPEGNENESETKRKSK